MDSTKILVIGKDSINLKKISYMLSPIYYNNNGVSEYKCIDNKINMIITTNKINMKDNIEQEDNRYFLNTILSYNVIILFFNTANDLYDNNVGKFINNFFKVNSNVAKNGKRTDIIIIVNLLCPINDSERDYIKKMLFLENKYFYNYTSILFMPIEILATIIAVKHCTADDYDNQPSDSEIYAAYKYIMKYENICYNDVYPNEETVINIFSSIKYINRRTYIINDDKMEYIRLLNIIKNNVEFQKNIKKNIKKSEVLYLIKSLFNKN